MSSIRRTSIETIDGTLFDYANPTKEMVSLNMIATGLSRQPRFAGQTKYEAPYSVAQHSVLVGMIVFNAMSPGRWEHDRVLRESSTFPEYLGEFHDSAFLEKYRSAGTLLGLMHDGSESVFCDLPTPAKNLPGMREAYLKVEKDIMYAIHDHFDLLDVPRVLHSIVHWADQLALGIEARALVPSGGVGPGWEFLPEVDPAIVAEILPEMEIMDASEARQFFTSVVKGAISKRKDLGR